MNVEGKALDDPRFARAGLKVQLHRRDVLGRCAAIWHYCYEQRTDTLTMDDVDGLAEHEGFALALVAAGLAERPRGRGRQIRLKGTGEQLKWLVDQDAKRKLALEAKRATLEAKRAAESPAAVPRDIPRDIPRDRPTGRPSDLILDLDPEHAAALAPEREHEQQQHAQQTAVQQQQGSPAVRSGWTPPAGGLADREARRRVSAGEITNADVIACWEYCVRQGVHAKPDADARAAKLVAIQKPEAKRFGAKSARVHVASNDEWTEEDEKAPWEN